jgi:protein tyrosine/serine phosphatase
MDRSDIANEIVPGLWLGDIRASRDGEFLREKKIVAVFNCTKDLPFYEGGWNKYRVPVDDNLKPEEIRNMELYSFEAIYKLCIEVKRGPVLVHCYAGMQRSAAVVAMFLIASSKFKVEQAIAYIRSKRPIAFTPGPNFMPSMQSFERVMDTAPKAATGAKGGSWF